MLGSHTKMMGMSQNLGGCQTKMPSKKGQLPPQKLTHTSENQWLEDEVSFWNGPFLGEHINFQVASSRKAHETDMKLILKPRKSANHSLGTS